MLEKTIKRALKFVVPNEMFGMILGYIIFTKVFGAIGTSYSIYHILWFIVRDYIAAYIIFSLFMVLARKRKKSK